MVDRNFETNSSHLFKAISVNTINQIVSSGTNFLLSLFLLRVLTVSEFGVFGIIQAASFVLAGLGNSVFLTQMVVHYPDKDITERPEYVTSILFLIILSISTILLLSIIAVVMSKVVFNIDLELLMQIFSVIVFSAGFLLKEFFCRLAFTHRRETRALHINVAIAVALLVLIAAMTFLQIPISAHSVLYCYAISAVIGVVIGQLEVRLPLKPDWTQMNHSLSEAWGGGKWALFNDVLCASRQQAHVFITVVIAGPTGVAMINAAKLFLTPVMLLTPSFSQLFIVRLVTLRQSEQLKLLRNGIIFSVANAVCVFIYGLALIFSFHYISTLILSDKFPEIEPFVVAWFFVALLSAARYGLESIQKAMKRFKSLAMLNIPVTIVALASVYLLLITLGSVGSIYGLALAEMLLTLILARIVLLSAKEIQLDAAVK